MKVSSTGILFLAAITSVKAMVPLQPSQPPQPQCKTSGFVGCECTFVGGCDAKGSADPKTVNNPNLDGFAPDGMDKFAYLKGIGKTLAPNLGWMCEGGLVAILYDCNARIPLYAATVIEGNQAKQKVERTGAAFKPSTKLDEVFQQDDEDYKSRQRIFCYEDQQTTAIAWDGKDACPSPAPKAPIQKGHMVAAGYAREDAAGVKNTFVYTNCVPQFEMFNFGPMENS